MRSHAPRAYMPWLMYVVAVSFYLYEFLLRVSPNVLEGELKTEFMMDATQFGLFAAVYYWVYAPLQIIVGSLTDNWGPRRLLTFAIVLCSLSTVLLAYTQNYYFACVARVLIGAGSAFAFICCIKIVEQWFSSKLFPFLTGLTLAVGTLGAAAGGVPLAYALNFVNWRPLLVGIGAFGLILSIACWFIVRDKIVYQAGSKKSNTGPGFWACLWEVTKLPQAWLIGVYAFFVTAPSDAFGGAWGVKFLMEAHGISRDMASFAAVSMTFVGMACGSPVLGWVAGYFNNRKYPMFIAALIAAMALTGIIYLPVLSGATAAVLFFMFGAFGTYVLAFVVIRMITESDHVATAVGFVNMLSIFGSAGVTYFIGWLLDYVSSGDLNAIGDPVHTAQDYQISLLILPLFYLVSAIIVVPFIKDKKEPQHAVG